jgi:hypothetical protein
MKHLPTSELEDQSTFARIDVDARYVSAAEPGRSRVAPDAPDAPDEHRDAHTALVAV